ncbi:MAG: leucine-rich repeat domain-containing protein [Christensenellales bacterium]
MKKKIVLVMCMIMLLIMSMAIAVACDNKDKEPIDNGDSGIIDDGGNGGNGENNGDGDNSNNDENLNEEEYVDVSQYLTYQVVGDDLSVKGLQEDKKNAVSGVIDRGSQYIDKAKIVIPDYYKGKKVIGVESEAFSGCIGLRSITIPNSVTSIGYGAFKGCSNLTKMVIPFVGNTKDGSGDTHFGYIFGASSYSYNSSYVPSSLESVILTGGNSIGDYAFNGCTGLTSITIPNSVTSIGSGAFSGCSNFAEITIPFVGAMAGKMSSDTYQYPFGYIFGESSFTGGVATDQYYYGSSTSSTTSTTYYIPSTLKSVTVTGGNILYGAFSECTNLTSVTIGKGVINIGRSAFYNCHSLISIAIADSVTSIGEYAFLGCISLIEVYNKSVLDIIAGSEDNGMLGYYAKNIYIQEGKSKLNTDKYGYVKYTDGADKILVKYTGSETNLTLPGGITEINQGAFSSCSSLTSITIPNSVTSIGNSAFSGCSSLTSIAIPNSVTSIGSGAFSSCSSLTSITIPDSVTSIGDRAFYFCHSLTSITIPDSVTSIGDYTFAFCISLTSIKFQGVKLQWDAISKGNYWNDAIRSYTVYCTDGTISK